jgi:two-component system chemotaxis response regulator CheB
MNKVRVLVVDDSSFVRKALLRIFQSDSAIEVVGLARSGKEAVEQFVALKPDVITLDIIMPEMDGLETLRRIMEIRPTPVLMLSQLTRQGADLTLKALELGAMDFIDKSSAGLIDIFDLAQEIIIKVRTLSGSRPIRIMHSSVSPIPDCTRRLIDAVAIGASTGGPLALQVLLSKFPKHINFAVLIVQHMPHGFTGPLAKRLDSVCDILVKEAETGEPVVPGTAYVAPAGLHMTVRGSSPGRSQIVLSLEPVAELHKPSVDVLFSSVAGRFRSRSIGVILTGMGSDGVKGLRALKDKGSFTIAQDESTSAMFGMPRVAAENGVVDQVLPITSITEEILRRA